MRGEDEERGSLFPLPFEEGVEGVLLPFGSFG
jgi:hypothetical protein